MKIYSAQLKGTTTVATGSNVSLTGSFTGSIYGFNDTIQYSSSVDSRIVVNTNRLNNIESTTASFSPRVSNLESKSSSVDISISNINSFTSSENSKFTTLASYTGSNDTKWATLTNVTSSLITATGSYATTGSNTFFGTQVFSGSVYIANNLVVQGSSSIQYISASSVSIGTNIVQLNTANPSVRFAGLTMIDSGSVGGSGSFLYDSLQDEFIFVHRGNGTNVTSSHFVLGPETFDSLGNELYLSCNIISKGTGKEHLVDSCIFDNGTTTCIKNNLVGTGTACFGNAITAASTISIGGADQGYQLDVKKVSTGDSTFDTIANFYKASTNGTQLLIRAKNSLIDLAGSYVIGGGGPNTGLSFSVSPSAGSPTEAMRITNDGKTGVNMTTPCSKLHVAVSTNTDGIFLSRISSCTNKQAIFIAADDAVGAYIAGGTSPDGTSTQSDGFGRMIIQNGQSEGFQFQTSCALVGCSQSWSTRMVIKQVGNIGIGTTSPNASSPLHVKMCSNSNGDGIRIQAVCSGAAGSQPGIAFANISDSKRYSISLDNSGDILQITNNAGSNTFQMNQSSVACFGGTVCVPAGLVFAGGGCSLNYYYQSGNWAPQFYAGGSTSFGLGSQSGTGRYTRIGNVVSVHGQISWSGAGTAGSLLAIRLPFNSNAAARGGIAPGIISGISGMINGLNMISEINSCWLYLVTPQNGGSHVHLGGTNVTSGGSMLFSFGGTFITDDN